MITARIVVNKKVYPCEFIRQNNKTTVVRLFDNRGEIKLKTKRIDIEIYPEGVIYKGMVKKPYIWY